MKNIVDNPHDCVGGVSLSMFIRFPDLYACLLEIDCGVPGVLYNGFIDGEKTKLDSIINYRCTDGTTFIGRNESAICQPDGSWSNPLPKCLGMFLYIQLFLF